MRPVTASMASGALVVLASLTAAFPEAGWTTPGLQCRRRVCQGRICKPAPDPTIYVSLP